MVDITKSILVVGFNTRPLTYSLKKAGYEIYAVDFFGDLDLYPTVRDSFVLIKELGTDYSTIKDKYSKLLARFAIKMLNKYPEIDYLLIGSGLDDAFEERISILNVIKEKNYKIENLNNDIKTIENARNIEYIYDFLKHHNLNAPLTIPYQKIKLYEHKFQFPLIFKKFRSAGGINVRKIENSKELSTLLKSFELKTFNPSDWLIQEYIEGIPVSCTTISNGEKCEVISINYQIIGEKHLNPPKDFIYCGNIVPSGLAKKDEKKISKISKMLTLELELKGINGFDYVLEDHYPYLMEINPRIPGSISASEKSLDLNLLDLHVKSFDLRQWKLIKKTVRSKKPIKFATKLIFFAPKEIDKNLLIRINNLKYIHDKSEPIKNILKGSPLCTVLYTGRTLQESYEGAIKIVSKIKEIIK